MFTIRQATFKDAHDIAVLCGQLGYPSTPEEVSRRLEYILNCSDHALFVAESQGGTVIGWAHVYNYVLPESDLIAEVGGIVVDQNHRGMGIGRKLIKYVEQWAWENGQAKVIIRSNVIRSESHRFYENLGYAVVKKQVVRCRALTL
ncbi:MAG: GNAT family N-acetyltransferase [Firmicutes bacterium]|nr:GNAT family N-acetyltransferase [Bacillota bacterium]